MLNSDSRSRSAVGRIACERGTASARPPRRPPTIRISDACRETGGGAFPVGHAPARPGARRRKADAADASSISSRHPAVGAHAHGVPFARRHAWAASFEVRDRQERDAFSSNRHLALAYWWRVIFFRKPVSTFRDHALLAPQDVGLRVALAPARAAARGRKNPRRQSRRRARQAARAGGACAPPRPRPRAGRRAGTARTRRG